MTKTRDSDGDDNAPTAAIGGNATERHLVKARELLRQARSRLSSRDDGAADSNRSELNGADDEEGSDE